jgi:hypothetical protein
VVIDYVFSPDNLIGKFTCLKSRIYKTNNRHRQTIPTTPLQKRHQLILVHINLNKEN